MIAAAEEIDPTKVTPGAGGLLVFIFLLVAGYFLFRSLKKQLNKVDFPEEPGQKPTPTPGEGP
jgi:hypothetical protein